MKGRIPNWIQKIAYIAGKNSIVRFLLNPFYSYYKKQVYATRRAYFQKYALEMLTQFDKCCQDNGYNYFLIFGSLLGAIREHGFIAHDMDIDVAMFIEERNSKIYHDLKKYGFKLIHRFRIEDGSLGCEETFVYKNTDVSLDIFYICPPINKYPYCCCWNRIGESVTDLESMKKYGGLIPRRIEMPFEKKIDRVQFENIEVNIPHNAHQISEFSYGKNYMIPDPNYKAPKEHRVIWKEKLAVYEEFH